LPHAIYQLFFWVHRLSIDIALGATAVLFGLSQALLLPIPWYFYVLLFNGTFIVYWIDHIQDSAKSLLVQPGARHAIFKEQRSLFVFLILIIFAVNAALSYLYLEITIILWAMALVLSLLAYLRFHRSLKRIFILEKEILIGLLYTLSTGFTPLVYFKSAYLLDWVVLSLLLLGVFLCTLQNLFSIARIEQELDSLSHTKNICHRFGSSRLKNLQDLMLLLQLACLALLYLLFSYPHLMQFCLILLLVSVIQYALPFWFKQSQTMAYRWIGDGAYLLLFLCA